MISDVSFDLAGSSAIAALSPNGWHLAVVRHGVAIDFFDARDLCSSTPSSSNSGASAPNGSSINNEGGGGASTNMRNRQRKLGALQGTFSTVDDVSSLVWSPDSSMVAACMEARGALTVVSALAPFHAVATVEGALNGARAHVVWHPSSRAVYWSGLAQTHVLNLSDGATMVLDYHAKVVAEDPRADAAGSAGSNAAATNGQHRSSPLPMWALPNPCPSPTAAAASSPTSSRILMEFSNGDGAAAKEYRQAMAAAAQQADSSQQQQQQQQSKARSRAAAGNNNSSNDLCCPPLFLCMVSPCSVAAGPAGSAGGNIAGIRSNMIQVIDPNSNSSTAAAGPQVLVNASSAQSVASTTAVLEEAAGVRGAATNSRISVTTEFFHVYSSITHELVCSFPIRLAAADCSSSIDTGGEFSVTSFCISPCFVVFHDSFSSIVSVFSHRGENVGPNVGNATAYAVTPTESVDSGSTLAVVHNSCQLSVFCATRSNAALVRLFCVDLARPQSYMGFSNNAASPLVVLAERQAPDDLLERARNEAMTEKAVAAHRADPAHTMPAAPPNRSMYDVLMPSQQQQQGQGQGEKGDQEDENENSFVPVELSGRVSASSAPTLSLIPGLRSKSLLGLCHDPQSRQIVEEFLRHTMRKTEVRNMMDDVLCGKVKPRQQQQQQQHRRRGSGGGGAISSITTSSSSKTTTMSPANLAQVSSEVLSEIAPLAFRDYGYCSVTSFHSAADHTDQLYVACAVPMFPTCVWIVDAASGKVVSLLQQKNVVTTLSWKPTRDVLVAQQQQQQMGGMQQQQQQQQQRHALRPLNHLEDPILAFTTDSHVGCLYLWTPESALCVAMPEIAKVASHLNNSKQQQQPLSDKTMNGENTNFECKMHISCENPNCRRNWLHRQKEIEKRRAFERGELGGFRCTAAAWTDAGNTVMLIDTVRGSHVVASLVPSAAGAN